MSPSRLLVASPACQSICTLASLSAAASGNICRLSDPTSKPCLRLCPASGHRQAAIISFARSHRRHLRISAGAYDRGGSTGAGNYSKYSSYNSNSAYYDDIEVDMDPEKMLKPGDPNTVQATIRKAMPVGYWVTMPSRREAFLPAQDLGFLGGLEKLRQIFQPGQEVTVRVVTRGGSGREILSLKKPDPNNPDPPPKPLRKEFESGRRHRPSRYS